MKRQESLETTVDHLIFGSYFLEDGVNFIFERLGVRPVKGGQHLTMGTHNAVLKLANTTYLKVIAIDPDSPKPPRPVGLGWTSCSRAARPNCLPGWLEQPTSSEP